MRWNVTFENIILLYWKYYKTDTFARLKTDLVIDNVNNDLALYGRLKGFRVMKHWHWQTFGEITFQGNKEIIVNVVLKRTETKHKKKERKKLRIVSYTFVPWYKITKAR